MLTAQLQMIYRLSTILHITHILGLADPIEYTGCVSLFVIIGFNVIIIIIELVLFLCCWWRSKLGCSLRGGQYTAGDDMSRGFVLCR